MAESTFQFPDGELTHAFELGSINDRSVRVWFRSPDCPNPEISLRVSGFEPVTVVANASEETDWTGYADATLPAPAPSADFSCTLGNETRHGRFAPSPGESIPFTFAFGSCNRPYELGENNSVARNPVAEFYDHMTGELAAEDASFLILGGDQVYSDEIDPISVRLSLPGSGDAPPPMETLISAYREVSRGYLAHPGFKRLREQLPSVWIWDDHDIYDNWGSTLEPSPMDEAMFEAAAHAYTEYQHPRNPGAKPGRPPYHYWFQYGTAGFFVTDVRGCRDYTEGTILGRQQWEAIDAFLDSDAAEQIDTLFIVSSIPLVHTARWVGWLTSDWDRKVADTVRDRWVSNAFLRHRNQLLHRLFAWQAERPNRQVIALSGDVHVASSMTLRERRGPGILEQFTSSAMTSPLETAHILIHRIVTRGLNLLEPDFEIQRHFVCAANNYGLVRLVPLPEGGHRVRFTVRGWNPKSRTVSTLAERVCTPELRGR